jgi:hypothetical protein
MHPEDYITRALMSVERIKVPVATADLCSYIYSSYIIHIILTRWNEFVNYHSMNIVIILPIGLMLDRLPVLDCQII